MINSPRSIESIVSEGYRIDIGAHIRAGIERLKKHPAELIGFALAVMALQIVLSFIPYAGAAVSTFLVAPLAMSAYYLFIFDSMRGKHVGFDSFVQVTTNLPQYLVVGLLVNLAISIGSVFCLLPGIFAAIVLMFAVPLVADRGIDPIEALKSSYRVAMKNLGDMIILGLVCLGLLIAGGLLCGVGLLVTVPLIYCIVASVYAEVFGLSGAIVVDSVEQ